MLISLLKESGTMPSHSTVLKICAKIFDIISLICLKTFIDISFFSEAESPVILEIILFNSDLVILLK